ncbi:MAG: sensor domain-containing diguanylate cyclase [Burkholderiales bacterium]|nr:MAG: sensor domain-containing diguanylate cyclase [Burkholderiales bacterium]
MNTVSLRAWLPPRAVLSAEEARLYTEESYAVWRRQSIIGGLLALAFNNAFLLMDYLIGPEVFKVGLQVRLYWSTSLGLIAPMLGVMSLKGFIRPAPVLQEIVVVATAAMSGLSILLVAALSPIHSTYWGIFYHVGLVPTMVFGTVMARLRFRAAGMLVAAILLMHWVALACAPHIPQAPVMSVMLSVAIPAMFMLMFSFQFEQAELRRFAQKQRGKALRAQLLARRGDLERASFRDPLTDVSNRRGFSAEMDQLLSSSAGEPQPYAMLLIDIDHFKLYNDRYGHLGGDECLRRVSQALAQVASNASAVLARWGGEEFVMALPDADAHDLAAFGQRLCVAVREAAIPHDRSPTADIVTISVGAVSSTQCPAGVPWSAVLEQADLALYRAKHEGRNQAVTA